MIKVANAPVSWGVIENIEGERSNYTRVLSEIQETGYVGTELGDWGFLPTDVPKLKQVLETYRLKLLASWVGVAYADREAHADGEARAVRTARLLAAVVGEHERPLIVLGDDHSSVAVRTNNAGRIQPEHAMNDDQWKVYAEGVNRIALAVREQTGLRAAFHHHCATWVETPHETEKLLSLTDPDVVGLCFDTGHYRFGGGVPLAGLKQHAERIWHIHFKDHNAAIAARSHAEEWDYTQSVRQGVFTELGQGDIDFAAILDFLKADGYDGWIVVEQDVLPGMGSPKESAQRSRVYLRDLGL